MVDSKENVKKTVTLDEILVQFNKYGCYYSSAIALLFLACLTNGLYSANYVFVTVYDNYKCKDVRFANNLTCSSLYWNGTKHYCTDWVYEDPNSFMAEFQLACQDWKTSLVATVHNAGYMVGLLIVGPLSDRWGRKTLLILTGVIGGIMGLARSFTYSYWLFIILEFLEGAIGDICSPVFMMGVEMVASKRRLTFSAIIALGFSTSYIILPLAAWCIPYWRSLLQALYAPVLLIIGYYYLIDESPRWLLSRGRKEDTVTLLEKIANRNNQKIDRTVFENISYEKDKGESFAKLVMRTFTSKSLLKRFFICLTWWMVSTFVANGMQVNCIFLAGNKYVNYGFFFIDDVIGQLASNYFMLRFRRKYPLIFSFIAGAVFCFIQPFMPLNMPWLSVLLFMIGNLMLSFYFNITYIFTSELFPTYTRNSMHALCSSLGRIGSLLGAQTPLLMNYWQGWPSMLFGAAALVGGLVTFFVPDIADDALPDTVHQAEELDCRNTDP